MDKKRILVTGVGGNVAQGVLRIVKSSFPEIYLVGCDINKFNAGSHLCNESFQVPYSSDNNYIFEINRIIKDLKISLLIPTTDLECLILSKNKIECPVLVSEHKLCKMFIDKFLTFEVMKSKNISFANSILPSKYNSEFKDIILKPRKGSGSKGVLINPPNICDYKDEEYLIQEFLIGKEITTSVYIDNYSNIIGLISLERELKAGTTVAAKIYNKNLEKIYSLAKKINSLGTIKGSFNIQSIVCEDNNVVPFEINLRISGTASIRHCFGFKDVEFSIKEYLFGLSLNKVEPIQNTNLRAKRILMDVIYNSNEENNHDNFYLF